MTRVHANYELERLGLKVITLENRLLRVTILPELGGRIWQIVYKPHDVALLWNNPAIQPARLPRNSSYDDNWSGGWDELFPNDEAAAIDREEFPDHGELWTQEWAADSFENADGEGVRLRCVAPVSGVVVEKIVLLPRDLAQLRFTHAFHNARQTAFPFLWKLHPAFAVSSDHRIDFPAMQVALEPAFLGTLEGGPTDFEWPRFHAGLRVVDLRRVPPASERQLYFFYGHRMRAGWCALTNTRTRLSCILQFDPRIFRSCWLFATYGGWRDCNVAVLEPATGYPFNFAAMQAAGLAQTLAPNGALRTAVIFHVREGISSVGKLDAEGNATETAD